MSDPNELISVYEAANVTEAHFVKNMLIDEGIEASVSEENEPLALPIAAPDVLIFAAKTKRARAIIDKYDEEQEARADRPDWKCPACGATVHRRLRRMRRLRRHRPGSEEADDSGDGGDAGDWE